MSESADVEARRQALEKLLGELTELVDATAEAVKPVDLGEPIGRISRVDAMQQQGMAAENRRAAQLRRRQVEAALERIEAGEYGECLGCGEQIEAGRLGAKPEAAFCLECQTRREESRG
jgi:DnaK suppressor protein